MTTLIYNRVVNHMSEVIAKMENIPHEKLKVSIWFNYIFITDGERLFRVKLNKSLAKFILSCRLRNYYIFEIEDYLFEKHYARILKQSVDNGMSDVEAEDSTFSTLCNASYKEVKSTVVKIYVEKYLAAAMEKEGVKIHQTLNGSRKDINNYLTVVRDNLINCAVDIHDFQYPDHIQYMLENNMKLLIDMKKAGVDIYDLESVRSYIKETLEQKEKEAAIMDFVIKFVENVA